MTVKESVNWNIEKSKKNTQFLFLFFFFPKREMQFHNLLTFVGSQFPHGFIILLVRKELVSLSFIVLFLVFILD